ncbi:hypothetical protein BJV78DRAFT_1126595, partial [Lactifluus subvellereus]
LSTSPPTSKNPFCAAESAIAIQMERMRAGEAIAARDVIAQHLSLACKSIRDKSATIDTLRQQNKYLEDILKEQTSAYTLSNSAHGPQSEQPSLAGQDAACTGLIDENARAKSNDLKEHPSSNLTAEEEPPNLHVRMRYVSSARPRSTPFRQHPEAEESIRARHAILAALPLPAGIPSDALRPILIPSSYTLQEFLASAVGLTTNWCPEREEHGYFLTPLFKCSTNPRVATAHRWMMVDVVSKLDKPTECFYNKDGKWYYAGVYKTIRLDDLTTKEFEQLSTEASHLYFSYSTTQSLIKETLAGRKNVSPQIVYETTQLYLAGALKIACVGLQCVGFNDLLYRTILEQATKCAQSGRWRSPFSFDLCLNSDVSLTPRLFSLPGTPVNRSSDGDNLNANNLTGDFCRTR